MGQVILLKGKRKKLKIFIPMYLKMKLKLQQEK